MLEEMTQLVCQKALFDLPEHVTYLNCAYMAPMPKSVEEAGIAGIRRKLRPYEVSPSDFFTHCRELRQEFARLIDVAIPEKVAIVPSVSYALANVARNIHIMPGEHILVATEQFPSNIYIWQRLAEEKQASVKVISPPEGAENRGAAWNEAILNAIGPRTRVVALANIHWADGTLFDLQQIRLRSRMMGSVMVIDGTQSIGALPLSVREVEPDAVVAAGYKWLMGPYSIGMAYYGGYFDYGKPIEENWINRQGSEDFRGLVNYQEEYGPYATKYEVGEKSNFTLVPMMREALRLVNEWGPESIQAYCRDLTQPLVETLRGHGFWIEDEAFRGAHMFGVKLPDGMSMEPLSMRLKEAGIHVSIRGNSIRIAPHLYNDAADMEKLLQAFIA